jgi:hypothetical protein
VKHKKNQTKETMAPTQRIKITYATHQNEEEEFLKNGLMNRDNYMVHIMTTIMMMMMMIIITIMIMERKSKLV